MVERIDIQTLDTKTNKPTKVRWVILGLLFLGAVDNYIDRTVFGLAAPLLKEEFGITTAQYGYLAVSFSYAYMIFYAFAGRAIDALGTRLGYILALSWWSVACIGHALARSVFRLGFFRVSLAAGEAGCWPASTKAVAEWFPKKERPLASGIFDSGSKAGMVIGPVFIAFLLASFGWRYTFVINGLLGFILIPFWIWLYRRPEKHKWVNKAELNYINQDETEQSNNNKNTKVPWAKFLTYPQTYGFMLVYGSTSLAWMVLQNYLPLYFMEERGVDITTGGIATSASLTGAVLGNILGGVIIGKLITKCKSMTFARLLAVIISAIMIASMLLAVVVPYLWMSIFFMAVCGFGFSMASTNAISMPGDFVPRRMVGSFWGLVATGSMLWMLPLKTFVGKFTDMWGWMWALTIPALLPFVGIIGMVFLIRKVQQLPGIEALHSDIK